MEPVIILIIMPFIFAIFTLCMPRNVKVAGETAGIAGSVIFLIYSIQIFLREFEFSSRYFVVDELARFILIATGFFALLISIYSISYLKSSVNKNKFYAWLLFTLGGASGVVLSNNLILLLTFWGFLGLTLYMQIALGGAGASDASKKTLIIIGASDGLMILGAAAFFTLTGTWSMNIARIDLVANPTFLPTIAFLCLISAAIAKAGSMPFHTWIPECADKAPVPVTSLLPASLDKLLGIYLLVRVSMNLFILNRSMQLVMLIIGALTIVAGVFMALAQHNIKKLLGYHAVSQVGYMIIGVATGTPVGIAGCLFHMLNNAIYKSCLFLGGGAVQKRAGTDNLDKLGGLARFMPVTFLTSLVAALAISGVPPFNGFTSKWMVYQGIIELGKEGDKLWIIWLAAAMFGSALTLASFMKLIHAVFLGQQSEEVSEKEIKEVSWIMWIPMAILAFLCLATGIFAGLLVLEPFIIPVIGQLRYLGFWDPVLATLLILVGLFAGGIIYLLGRPGAVRESDTYVGGEILEKGHEVSGADFYKTVQDMGFIKTCYGLAEKKMFDVYEVGKKLVFGISRIFQVLHTGVLPFYLIWCLIGMAALLFVFFGGGR